MSEPAALGIMAYNEERNIGRLLDSVLAQTASDRIAQIVVVASGCTDRTCEIVRAYASRDSRLSLIAEPARHGKVSAINQFLFNATQEILMVSSADLVYDPHAVERLLAPFDDPDIGMVGAHSIPLDKNDTFFGYAVNLMWSLHHDISLRDPKMGELIAFRNVFRRLNPKAICDMRDHNVPVSTMRTLPVLRAALPYALRQWRKLHWTVGAAALEFYCRAKAQSVYRSRRRAATYRIWDPANSTKSLEGPLASPLPPERTKAAQ